MRQIQNLKTVLLCSMFLTASISLSAQEYKKKQADKKFENLEYIDAIKVYEELANKGYENVDLYKKLGDAYYFNADYTQAAQWYDKLFTKVAAQPLEYKFRYGQCSKSIGKDKQANDLLTQYFASKGISYTELNKSTYDYTNKYKIKKEACSTDKSDYPAFMNESTLYLVSASSNGYVNPWSNEKTSDIFIVSDSDKKEIEGDINTKYNEGSMVMTKDGKTLYFTRNDFNNKKRGKDDNNITRLKLYRAKNVDNLWGEIEELPFNNSSYSVGHPALTKDEKTLFFVSDMPGGKGGTDIYSVSISDDGSFGSPVNIEAINTFGNEMFPFVADDNTMYFSSNGYSNLGGLDVYSSTIDADSFGKVTNVGSPINGSFDDFAFLVDSKGKGYFASNRENSNDDVYSFETNFNFLEPCKLELEGLVKDKKTGDLLSDALISLINSKNEIVNRVDGGSNGAFSLKDIDCNDIQMIRIERKDYQTIEVQLPQPDADGKIYKDFMLERREIPTNVGTDIALLLNPIYFDLDQSYIRPDAEVELQKVIAILKQYPTIKINVRSHTDSRADDHYNMTLSNQRAQATVNYIVNKGGVERYRVTGQGYGETQLVNRCSNGVSCSEAEHQANRRSEFIIVK